MCKWLVVNPIQVENSVANPGDVLYIYLLMNANIKLAPKKEITARLLAIERELSYMNWEGSRMTVNPNRRAELSSEWVFLSRELDARRIGIYHVSPELA